MRAKSTASASARRAVREDRLDRVFAALSHRARRALLAELERGPAMITQLAQPFDMSLPAVSKHLRVLENAGLVKRTVEGRVHRCALDAAAMRDADLWLEHYRSVWTDSLEALAQLMAKEGK